MYRFANRITMIIVAVITGLVMVSCGNSAGSNQGSGDQSSSNQSGDSLKVYATTGYLADAVANIAPAAQVTTMVGPGGDPHTYQPSTGDIQAMKDADLVVWNSLYLEAQMIDQLRSLGDKQLAVGELVPVELLLDWPETDPDGNALHDPHIWNNPEAWQLVVGFIADKLSDIDPDNSDQYQENAISYQAQIEQAADKAEELLAKIPADSRILITGHDAFNYFGKRFNLKVYATDFVSSEAQKSPEEIEELAKLIADNKVPVIFQDNLAAPQAITSLKEAVASRGWQVAISEEELFADSLGPEPPVDNYLGVLEHNAKAVADALGSEK